MEVIHVIFVCFCIFFTQMIEARPYSPSIAVDQIPQVPNFCRKYLGPPDPKMLGKCVENSDHVDAMCLPEIMASMYDPEGGPIGPICCKLILQFDPSCISDAFGQIPHYFSLLTRYCQLVSESNSCYKQNLPKSPPPPASPPPLQTSPNSPPPSLQTPPPSSLQTPPPSENVHPPSPATAPSENAHSPSPATAPSESIHPPSPLSLANPPSTESINIAPSPKSPAPAPSERIYPPAPLSLANPPSDSIPPLSPPSSATPPESNIHPPSPPSSVTPPKSIPPPSPPSSVTPPSSSIISPPPPLSLATPPSSNIYPPPLPSHQNPPSNPSNPPNPPSSSSRYGTISFPFDFPPFQTPQIPDRGNDSCWEGAADCGTCWYPYKYDVYRACCYINVKKGYDCRRSGSWYDVVRTCCSWYDNGSSLCFNMN